MNSVARQEDGLSFEALAAIPLEELSTKGLIALNVSTMKQLDESMVRLAESVEAARKARTESVIRPWALKSIETPFDADHYYLFCSNCQTYITGAVCLGCGLTHYEGELL